jgi:hypothetical protein
MHGDISFLELGATEADISASITFFATLFGWQVHSTAQGGTWLQGPRIRVGMHGDDPGPKIYVFFGVFNLEAAVKNVRQAGGYIDMINVEPNFGRFASCRDPQGIHFGLHQPSAS